VGAHYQQHAKDLGFTTPMINQTPPFVKHKTTMNLIFERIPAPSTPASLDTLHKVIYDFAIATNSPKSHFDIPSFREYLKPLQIFRNLCREKA
jgi:hypothetical protein